MDPVTVGVTLVNFAVFATNVLRLIQELRSTRDPRVKLIQTKLMGERYKFANWMLVMQVSNMDDLQHRILPNDYEVIKELYSDLQFFFEETDAKLAKFRLHGSNSFTSRAIMIRSRINLLIFGGFDDLRLLVETLEALNSTLYAIAEPPPKYSVASGLSEPAPSAVFGPSPEETHVNTPASTGSEIEPKRIGPKKTPILRLYKECLRALAFISSQIKSTKHGQIMESIVFRLKIWAIDFVDGSYSLDSILVGEDEGRECLRTAIIGTLVDVALIEEQFLGLLARSSEDYNSQKLEHIQLEVVAMLGTDVIVSIAVEHSSPMLDEEDPSQAIANAVGSLASAIGSLFDLIPALRTLRREKILVEELLVANPVKETQATLMSAGIRWPLNSATQNIDHINMVSEMQELPLEQDQRERDECKSVDSVYSQLFKKELERLKECRDAIQEKMSTTQKGDERMVKLREVLSRVNEGLAEGLPKREEADVGMSRDNKSEKLPPGPVVLSEKLVKQKIELLRDAVEELRQMQNLVGL